MTGPKDIRARRLAALEERRLLAARLSEFEALSRFEPGRLGASSAQKAEDIRKGIESLDERLAVLAEVSDDPEELTPRQKRLVAEEALLKVLPRYRLEGFETGTDHDGECPFIEIRLEWHRFDPYEIFGDDD